ncbi:Component of a membrane-bound complex containing the Tor2p kinase [Vanrija albida]|uniref:Component of a membrane-bound complex containing the Tor2p kinase n=1 Tax=Vanrija albida TaxID=181172 RepID=A0ABR3PXS0_9TREE
MAMISDPIYALHAIRLSALRTTDDPVTPRIVTLDPAFGLNPYISAMGLGDIDKWPEIQRALDSPPPERAPLAFDSDDDDDDFPGPSRPRRNRRAQSDTDREALPRKGGAQGLRYTQTIVGAGRSGGAGMRVSGRRAAEGRGAELAARRALGGRSVASRAQSSSEAMRPPMPPLKPHDQPPQPLISTEDVFTSSPRARADSAPSPAPLGVSALDGVAVPETVISDEGEGDVGGDDISEPLKPPSLLGAAGYDQGSSMGVAASALPSDLAMTAADSDPLTVEMVDEGSDVGSAEVMDDDVPVPAPPVLAGGVIGGTRRASRDVLAHPHYRVSTMDEDRRSSTDTTTDEKLEFKRLSAFPGASGGSALTSALNQHVPHLVSTGGGAAPPSGGASGVGGNPFASLYASVAAPPTVPSMSLSVFFPHSEDPSEPIEIKVRKDATVEEVTGHGLWKYWDEGREPKLEEEEDMSTVGWGLRIVEDDGEVDEDFPPLDREGQISRFGYAEFGIVRATDSQKKQNAAMQPLIQRRPSRIISAPMASRPVAKAQPAAAAAQARPQPIEYLDEPPLASTARTAGLSSSNATPVLLRVQVRAGADVRFTTTISVPSDMYIADLTEVLVERKHLQQPSSDWVLCLADLSFALPLDKTVASLEGKSELALVKRQFAAEYGLRAADRVGGDPNSSMFKRATEPASIAARLAMPGDFAGTYKKYQVQRKTGIGRHARILAIDGDYIHILPSENRTFFDTMKTTSFHITLVASVKLSGRAGGFKIYVWRDGNQKRYEFEAENGKQAQEIVATIKDLMRIYQTERRDRNSVGPGAVTTPKVR